MCTTFTSKVLKLLCLLPLSVQSWFVFIIPHPLIFIFITRRQIPQFYITRNWTYSSSNDYVNNLLSIWEESMLRNHNRLHNIVINKWKVLVLNPVGFELWWTHLKMISEISIWQFQVPLTGPRITETASTQLNTIQISHIQHLHQTGTSYLIYMPVVENNDRCY